MMAGLLDNAPANPHQTQKRNNGRRGNQMRFSPTQNGCTYLHCKKAAMLRMPCRVQTKTTAVTSIKIHNAKYQWYYHIATYNTRWTTITCSARPPPTATLFWQAGAAPDVPADVGEGPFRHDTHRLLHGNNCRSPSTFKTRRDNPHRATPPISRGLRDGAC